MPKPYSKTVRDVDGDPARVTTSGGTWPEVVLRCRVGDGEGRDETTLALLPVDARRLARALRRAARVAEGKPARKPKARTPQVGDRVRVLEDSAASANVKAGDLGAVVGTDGGYLLVAMDKPRRGAHRESIGRAYDWFFRPEHVELVR